MPITQARLDAKADRQAARVVVWARAANRVITGQVADAEAHAIKALTEALKAEPEGRPTIRRVRRSRSVDAAEHRLHELLDGLVGPSRDSLDGLIRDGRERFLAEAMAEWAALLDPSVLRNDPKPTEAERRAIRRHEVHGLALRDEIGSRVEDTIRRLKAAVAQASGRSLGDRAARTILSTWEEKARSAILSSVKLALSDSMSVADTAAQWLLLRPELRDGTDEPLIVGV